MLVDPKSKKKQYLNFDYNINQQVNVNPVVFEQVMRFMLVQKFPGVRLLKKPVVEYIQSQAGWKIQIAVVISAEVSFATIIDDIFKEYRNCAEHLLGWIKIFVQVVVKDNENYQ